MPFRNKAPVLATLAALALSMVYLGKLRGGAGLGAIVFALLIGLSMYRSGLPRRARP